MIYTCEPCGVACFCACDPAHPDSGPLCHSCEQPMTVDEEARR